MRRAGGIVFAIVALWAVPARAAPPELPPPTYGTVSQEVAVTMDDGVRLGATITRPNAPGRFPVVLQMTPYGRDGACSCFPGADLASRGLASAVVDVRGTGGSEGTLKDNYFSPREQRDGYELVEWLARQPWSSGRVGMTGGSYVGITQYLTAEQQPPHLKVITPLVALSDLYREGYTHEGIPNFFFDEESLAVQQPLGMTGPNGDPAMAEMTVNAKVGQATGAPGVAFDYLERPYDGSFYRDRSPLYRASKIDVP